MEEKNKILSQQTKTITPAHVARRFASLIVDVLIARVIFVALLYALSYLLHASLIQQLYNTYTTPATGTAGSSPLDITFYFAFMLVFAFYSFVCLMVWNRTAGMLSFDLAYVTSDAEGNPHSLTVPQKFLRGFVCNMLTVIALFIPSIPWPYDRYKRSFIDYISKVFVMQEDERKLRNIIAYIVVCIFLLVSVFSSLILL